jgi:GAF domain-containing protein
MTRDDALAALQQLLQRLLEDLDVSRTTVRLDVPELRFDVNDVAAEARRSSVRSLKGERSLDQRQTAAFRWLDVNRRVFVENDCLNAEPGVAPEPEVIEIYGLRAEMVAPLIRAGDLIGALSVHYTPGPREWRADEVARLEAACEEVQQILDQTA